MIGLSHFSLGSERFSWQSFRSQVHSWHQRLKPILLHSERRNDFDVKETSRNIVASFSDGDSSLETKTQDNRLVSFESIMERRDKADTARYFFSMLQMVSLLFGTIESTNSVNNHFWFYCLLYRRTIETFN